MAPDTMAFVLRFQSSPLSPGEAVHAGLKGIRRALSG